MYTRYELNFVFLYSKSNNFFLCLVLGRRYIKQGQTVHKTAKRCRQTERHTDKQKTKSRNTKTE